METSFIGLNFGRLALLSAARRPNFNSGRSSVKDLEGRRYKRSEMRMEKPSKMPTLIS